MDTQWINFFDISFKCQALALAVEILLLIDFLRSKKMPLRSSFVFGWFMSVCLFNLVADIVSVFTVYNHKVVPDGVNKLVHMLFYCSIELMTMTLFLYVFYLFGAQKRFSKPQILLCAVPFILAAVGSSFADIYYVSDERGAYSYGPALVILYSAIAVYCER